MVLSRAVIAQRLKLPAFGGERWAPGLLPSLLYESQDGREKLPRADILLPSDASAGRATASRLRQIVVRKTASSNIWFSGITGLMTLWSRGCP